MIKLAVLVFVCIRISTGYQEELAGYNSFASIDHPESAGGQVYYGEPQEQRRKPCPNRRNNAPADEQWVSSFKTMVMKPLNNNILEPLALKNENVDNLPAEPAPNTDPNEASNILNGSNQRSYGEDLPNNSNEQSANEDYDCDIGLGTDDYLDSQYGRQFSEGDSGSSKTTAGIEQKVVEMLKDCINKKQKYINDKLTQPEGIPLTGSRRSMGDSDIDNEDDDSKSVYNVSDMPTTKDTNEISTDVLLPGKLYNELQNPDKTTGLAEFPYSRRMPAENSRVCYACSSATNPSCWQPDSKTTIKYCRQDQNCVTKSFGVKNSLTVIRDCAVSCDASGVAGIEPKYKDCSVCHKDLCNSAAINSYNLVIILLITAIKYNF